MAVSVRARTYEDLCRMREDGNRYELIEGELVLVAAPSPLHQRLVVKLAPRFKRIIGESGLGQVFVAPIDVRFADGSVLQPDLVVVLATHARIVRNTLIEGTPSLVVEIAYRSSRAIDRGAQLRVYASQRVPEYWIVEPETRSITLFCEPTGTEYGRSRRETGRIESETVSGVAFDLDERF